MKKLLLVLVATVLMILLLILAAAAVGEKAVMASFETYGSDLLQTTVELEAVELDWWDGELRLRGLMIGSPVGYRSRHAARFREIRIDFRWSSGFGDAVRLDALLVDGGRLALERNGEGISNLQQIRFNIEAYAQRLSEAAEGGGVRRWSASRMAARSLSLVDEKGEVLALHPIELGESPSGSEAGGMAELVRRLWTEIERQAMVALDQVDAINSR